MILADNNKDAKARFRIHYKFFSWGYFYVGDGPSLTDVGDNCFIKMSPT